MENLELQNKIAMREGAKAGLERIRVRCLKKRFLTIEEIKEYIWWKSNDAVMFFDIELSKQKASRQALDNDYVREYNFWREVFLCIEDCMAIEEIIKTCNRTMKKHDIFYSFFSDVYLKHKAIPFLKLDELER